MENKLKKFFADTGELSNFVRQFIPKKDDWKAIKSKIVMENERVRLLAKVSVENDVANGAANIFAATKKLNFATLTTKILKIWCKNFLSNARTINLKRGGKFWKVPNKIQNCIGRTHSAQNF